MNPEELLDPLKVSRRRFFFLASLATLGAALPGKLWVPPPPTIATGLTGFPVAKMFGTAEALPLLKEIVLPGVRNLLNSASPLTTYIERSAFIGQ